MHGILAVHHRPSQREQIKVKESTSATGMNLIVDRRIAFGGHQGRGQINNWEQRQENVKTTTP